MAAQLDDLLRVAGQRPDPFGDRPTDAACGYAARHSHPGLAVRGEIRKTDVVKFDAAAGHGVAGADARTRDAVARLLLEHGPATAADLGGQLGLSTAAVRRHLDALVGDGLVTERPQRPAGRRPRGRGRPAKLFALTGSGREAFPHAYDDLAAAALRFLADAGGDAAVAEFAERRVAGLEDRLRSSVAGAGRPADRLEALADALSEEGYAASAHDLASGGQLCQHHCPVAHVAAEFPQLCEAETRAFARLLGTHVQRLATLARGDEVCTTHVPAAGTAPTIPARPVPARPGRKPL
jgi:predicted ArsR family transcriptional regulator